MLGLQGEARFGAGNAVSSTLGTDPPVLDGTAASLDCELVQEGELSCHVLMVGLVRAVRVTPTTHMTSLVQRQSTVADFRVLRKAN